MQFLKTLVFIGCWGLLVQSSSGQDFVLENPMDPDAASGATIAGGELAITDATGRRFTYQRRPDLDSPDGRFLAYYSREADQFLRWPARNAGNMQIGRVQLGVMAWTESRMQLRRVGPPAGGPNFVPGSPMHVGTLPLGPDSVCAAQIDSNGTLQFFIGYGERWRNLTAKHPPGILIPGAPVHLVADAGAPIPSVLTVGATGKFIQIAGGKVVTELPMPADALFVPGSHFEFDDLTTSPDHVFATDDKGRLWRLDLSGAGAHQMLESRKGIFEPGIPLQVLRGGHEVFVIDRRGTLVTYSQDPLEHWHGPEFLAEGFVSNGSITAWSRPGSTTVEIAAVDRLGRLQVLRMGPMGWTQDTLPEIVLPPGSPVTAFATSAGLSLTAVLSDGSWAEFFDDGGMWTQRLLGSGYPQRAPLASTPAGPMLFASDQSGRLIAALWIGTEWQTFVCVPGYFSGDEYAVAPRLASRKIYTNRPLNPVTVAFRNTSTEELIVRMYDQRVPGKVEELRLPPNQQAQIQADRDAGGTLEEVTLVPGPFGPVEQVRRVPLPPKQFYDIVVYANRVSYRYIDKRKQKGPLPNFEESSLVSIGAFPLVPGGALSAGTTLDVYEIATASRNPGAAAVIDPMRRLP